MIRSLGILVLRFLISLAVLLFVYLFLRMLRGSGGYHIGIMMDEEEESDSIIPEFALNAAQSGAAVPTIAKKRRKKKAAAVEPNVAIEESPEKQEKNKRSQPKKPSSKQTSLTSFLTAPPSGSRWKPVHKQAPASKKKVEVVKKKISIDPQETPRPARVTSVVAEVSSGDEDRSATETKRLANSIAKAKRRSIKQYLDSAAGKNNKKERPLKSRKSSAPRRKKETSQTGQQEDQSDANQDAAEPASRESPDVILLDPVSPVEYDLDDIEVVMEVQTPAAMRGTKRTRNSVPRSLQRLRPSVSFESAMDHLADHPRGAFTTPRRKISRNRSYSPLNFVFDEDELDVPSTPVVRRRRPDGESSIFDLNLPDEDHEHNQHLSTPSTSRGSATANVSSETTAVIVVEEVQSDGSKGTGASPPHIATAVVEEECVVLATQQSGTCGSQTVGTSAEVRDSSAGAPNDNEKPSSSHSWVLPSHESSLRGNSVGHDSALRTPPSGSCSARTDGTPSKSRSVSTLLYSPRRMAQTNEERLRTILSKNNNNYEIGPNLDNLVAGTDYCAFQVSTLKEDAPPQPLPQQCLDQDLNFGNPAGFVRLPWSTANILNGFHQCVEDVEKKYVIIDRALRSLVEDGAHCIEAVIVTLKECAPWIQSFDGLLGYMDGLSSVEEREALDVMAGIAKLAVNAKFAITAPVPLLRESNRGSVTLSQEQCACLLAHAFFCTYRREKTSFNSINMAGLFSGRNPLAHVKLQFILHYFSMVLKKMPSGCVSFWREGLEQEALPDWEHEEKTLPLLGVASNSSIEDSSGCLQIDFANEYIGGGVLHRGAVQEEIRFLICPEMIVSCLLCEKMGPLEVIRIVGAQRYSSYFGYGETLEWALYEDFGTEPRDEFRRVKCELVAMDAKLFKYSFRDEQYSKENIDRELNKAYVGFMSRYPVASPVATGNWGCGVFGGDKELKSLIQMIAAARAGRDMIYYTFANRHFQTSMIEQYEKLVQKKATIGTLYKALIAYEKERERNPRLTVYEHVYAFVSEVACTTS